MGTDVQPGLAAVTLAGPAATRSSAGAFWQHSSVMPGSLHRPASFVQHAIAAGPVSSQWSAAMGDPTKDTTNATAAIAFAIRATIA